MTDSYHPIPKGEPLPKDYETLEREELKKMLQVFIVDLLENNFEKLCNLAYRHDIPEVRFNEALEESNLDKQAARIADLVIDRELQKVESRRAYREEKQKRSLKK
jgi:molybdopterin-biosynthesis enzyme MoeA-like protein